MKKFYTYLFLFFCFAYTCSSLAQESKLQTIDGLNLYPNPVSNGKVYITSKSGDNKDITIYDVLGKLVFQISLSTKDLNVASLAPGIYIIKVRENDATATRKLIIK